ncbi:tRNA (adenosine(37)-N6)-threonylcarbamoyltransferase complex ATPase subunit type 1 TsaE [Marinobacter sp.]|uniref:tRNA (adenosine(37)-N6)-threonylcarbamoyltransferase complex ATPase subunit type 1 TsaE n=1 Tax=Marinobacter sp. TaxID=50741 RepID=UPI003850CD3E
MGLERISVDTFFLPDEAATGELGRQLAEQITAQGQGAVIFLEGELGMGKTTLSRGLIRGLGHEGAVKSPTYTLVEPYEHLTPVTYHFDLYRLGDPEELEYMGIRDYFQSDRVCLIEWAERGQGVLPEADLVVRLGKMKEGRQARLIAGTDAGNQLCRRLHGQAPTQTDN